MISRSDMLAPLLAVLVWVDRKLNIGGRGGIGSPAGPQMNCSRRGHRQPGIRLTGVRRAPYSIRGAREESRLCRQGGEQGAALWENLPIYGGPRDFKG